MLSEKIKLFLEARGTHNGSDDVAYRGALEGLDIPLNTAFADFNLHTTDVTFSGRKHEIYNVCWFVLNSNYDLGDGLIRGECRKRHHDSNDPLLRQMRQ